LTAHLPIACSYSIRISSQHARLKASLAARALASTCGQWHFFHHRQHLPQSPPFFRRGAFARPASGLLAVARDFGWQLEAWAVFSNHYHFVAHSPAGQPTSASLGSMLKTLHVKTARWINRLDHAPARQVWFNFRETRLTYPRSYLARLNYTHQNPVKHGLVPVASQYPWCSAAWFERTAPPAQIKTIYQFKWDKLGLPDEFDPSPAW